MKILAIDYGTKRIGLAISDPNETMALALPLLDVRNEEQVLNDIEALVKDRQVEAIVIGLPINMNDTIGPSAQAVLDFVKTLEARLNLPVATWDERLTSEQAKGMLAEAHLTRQKQRRAVNTVAAQIILDNYLESRRRKEKK